MHPDLISLIVFACVFGGALLGMFLGSVTPEHHLSEQSKDVIKLGMGLIATLAALVLGLVIASAKSSYDLQELSVKQMAAKVLLLDRELAEFGQEAKEPRDLLRRTVRYRLDTIWPEECSQPASSVVSEEIPQAERVEGMIRQLTPRDDNQRGLQARALDVVSQIMETRWFVLGGAGSSVSPPFLIVVVFWLTVIFASFGLFAPRNTTVIVVLLVCAMSVAGAIFLILEMDQPFRGVMKISSAPLRYVISHLNP